MKRWVKPNISKADVKIEVLTSSSEGVASVETEGKVVLAADERKETKKDSSVKQEMKERKNAVKRVYQRKSI